MTPNEEYYEDTVLENQVPWTNVGRILDEADPRHEAVGDAFAYSETTAISELGKSVRGELVELDEAAREEIGHAAGSPLDENVAAALRWSVGGEADESSSIHLLTAADVDTVRRSSLTMLLDAATAEVERDAGGYAEDHPLRRLAEEWRRRNPTTSGEAGGGAA